MILLKIIYLWTTLWDIAFCLTPSTLLALANLQNQKAKAAATTLAWKLKNRYNKIPKSVYGNRFIRDTGHQYIPQAYYVENLVPYEAPLSQNYEYQNLPPFKLPHLPPFYEYTPHLRGLFPNQLKYESDISSKDFGHDYTVGIPYSEGDVLGRSADDEEGHQYFDNEEEMVGTFNLFPFMHTNYKEPLYQNPSKFDPMQPENRKKVVDFIKSNGKISEMILHLLDPIDYHFNSPSNEPIYPTGDHKSDQYEDPSPVEINPALPNYYYESAESTHDFKIDKKLDKFSKNNKKLLEKFEKELKKKLTHHSEVIPSAYPIYTPQSFAEDGDNNNKYLQPETKLDPVKQDLLPTIYPLNTNEQVNYGKGTNKNLKPNNLELIPGPDKPNIVPGEYLEPPYKMDTIPPSFSYTEGKALDKINKKQDFGAHEPLPTAYFTNPKDFVDQEWKKIDKGVQNIESLMYNDQQQDTSTDTSYSQVVPEELEQVREATTNISNFDVKVKDLSHIMSDHIGKLREAAQNANSKGMEDSGLNHAVVDELEKIRELMEKHDQVVGDVYQPYEGRYVYPVNEAVQGSAVPAKVNPMVSYIIRVPNNYEYFRRSQRQVKNSTNMNVYLDKIKESLNFLRLIASRDEEMMLIDYLENIIVDSIQQKQKTDHSRNKRHIPTETLLLDPQIQVDMPKLMDNVGTFTKTLFDDKETPLYHVRNFVGSMKDVALATMKIPNQNFIVPTEYNIVDNPNKEETVLQSAHPDLSSRFGDTDDENRDWTQDLIQNTFQNVGQVVRNVVKSGQEAVQHVGEMTNHAKKVIMTTRQAPDILLQTVTPIPLETDKKKFSLNSRFGDDSIVAQKEQPPVQFIKMGHLLDAFGVSSPDRSSQSFLPRSNLQHIDYANKLRENLEKVVQTSNIVKNINKDVFPKNNKIVDSIKNYRNNLKDSIGESDNDKNLPIVVKKENNVKNLITKFENKLANRQKSSNIDDDSLVNKKRLKEDYVQNIRNKIEDFVSASNKNLNTRNNKENDYIKNIKNFIDKIKETPNSIKTLHTKNDGEKNKHLHKTWNKLEDMISATNPVNLIQKNNHFNGKNNKKAFSSFVDKNVRSLGDIYEHILQKQNELTGLSRHGPLGSSKINCNKRNKREVSDFEEARYHNDKEEELLGASFISPELTFPFLVPGLLQPQQQFGRTANENNFLAPFSDLINKNQDIVPKLKHQNQFSTVPNIMHSSLDFQHLLGPILGAPNPDMLKQSFNEQFTDNGISGSPVEVFQHNHDVNSDDEKVSTSLQFTTAMKTPFMGKVSEKKKEKFYQQYEPSKEWQLVEYPQSFDQYQQIHPCSCQQNKDYLYGTESDIYY